MQHSAWTEVWDRGMLTDPGWETPVAARGHCLGHKEPQAEPTAPVSSPTHSTRVCPPKCVPQTLICSSVSSSREQLTDTCSPHPPTQLSIATNLGNSAPFPPENPCQVLPAATSASCHLADRCSAQALSIIFTQWQPG